MKIVYNNITRWCFIHSFLIKFRYSAEDLTLTFVIN